MHDNTLVRIQIRHLFTTGQWSSWVAWDSGVRGDDGLYFLWLAKQHLAKINTDDWCQGRIVDPETKQPLEIK